MEFFVAEGAFGPLRKPAQNVSLGFGFPASRCAVMRSWELIVEVDVRAYSDNEDTSAVLSDAVLFCVQHLPLHMVTSEPIPTELIVQKLPVFAVGHPVDVLNDKSFRTDGAEHAVKLLV